MNSPTLARCGLWLRRLAEAAMALGMAGMVLAVFTNVVLRYVFDTGIVFYEELSRLLFVWLVCIGAIVASVEHKHLGFDMLTSRLKGWPRTACAVLARLGIAYVMVLVAIGSWRQVEAGMESRSTVIGYPLALAAASTLVLAVGMLAVLAVQVLQRERPGAPHGKDEGLVE
ncbi:TRAP transporter small permease [Caldimonas thermodepolymerans]|jgi:TRAP-type C4-dicarboxylate transport system, small permease component|uniref:TRAP transporter small permease n=1 Tax=Caldimonas thermodepolymerans TaxID=215580 RepID=UPI0024923B0A|nr:TRAP transporter small permease [Caldimonas thermodepolymerans]